MTHDQDDWDRHWDDYAGAAERNPAQAYRRRLALKLLERRGAPRRLLDIGSGQGDLLVAARRRWPAAALAGVEISGRGVEVARRKLADGEFHLADLTVDGAAPSGRAAWATHAVCSEVLEHVDDPVAVLRNARGWLAPGCRVVVTVPGGPMSAFDRHIGHRRHFSAHDLRAVLTDAGYHTVWATGAGFPFFNLYRGVVIARGTKLVDDVAEEGDAPASLLARVAMGAFDPLFRLNLPRSALGWQTVAVAVAPSA